MLPKRQMVVEPSSWAFAQAEPAICFSSRPRQRESAHPFVHNRRGVLCSAQSAVGFASVAFRVLSLLRQRDPQQPTSHVLTASTNCALAVAGTFAVVRIALAH